MNSTTYTCLFACDKEGPLLTGSTARLEKIIQSSKQRNDTLHHQLQDSQEKNPQLTIKFHKNCVSTYTSKCHIQRHLKRNGGHLSSNIQPTKRRSCLPAFDFKKFCFICGDECIPKDPKNPKRWRRLVQCQTIEIKEKILEVCKLRNDNLAAQVQVRILGAISDLHAADAQYHHDCYTSFTAKRNVGSASKTTTLMSSPVEQALSDVILAIKEEPTKIWNSVELYNIYTTSYSTLNDDDSEGIEELGSQENSYRHRRAVLLQMLESHFQNNLLVMKIDGCASLVCLREHAPQNLKLVTANDADPVADVVKIISDEVSREKLQEYDISSFTTAKAKEDTSSTLLCLVSGLVSSGKVTSKSLSLSQSIQTLINKKFNQTTLGLAVKLHHQFGSRELIDTLHECGYITSYDEVLRFRKSAAKINKNAQIFLLGTHHFLKSNII